MTVHRTDGSIKRTYDHLGGDIFAQLTAMALDTAQVIPGLQAT